MDDARLRAAMKELRDEVAGAASYGFSVTAEELVMGPADLDILGWPDSEPVACFRMGLLVGEIRVLAKLAGLYSESMLKGL